MTGYEPRNAREREAAEKALRELYAIKLANPRPKLCERVRGDPAPRGARFLTLAEEYAKRRTFARNMANPPANVFPAWAHPTRQSPAVRAFPETRDWSSVHAYARLFERMNNLRPA